MPVRVALPKGRLLSDTALFLEKAGWKLNGYDSALRNYRLESLRFPELQIKVFQEKDIPVQVAIGNYDLGICGLDWIEELSSKYATAGIVRIKDFDYGKGKLYVAAHSSLIPTLESLRRQTKPVKIASEYPNIAEAFALDQRLRKFNIFPVWGGAEAYPPESATLALIAGSADEKKFNHGLSPVIPILNYHACLITNRRSWEQKDMSDVLHTLENVTIRSVPVHQKEAVSDKQPSRFFPMGKAAEDAVRIALPDGHQQKHAVELLNRAGIPVDDYPSTSGNRRPAVQLEGVVAKVIRPQDMPLQIANGNFDLAITGHDWVTDHLSMFPTSPVVEIMDLKFGWVKIVAVVHKSVPADNIFEVRLNANSDVKSYRVASEYTNLADRYARENHLGMYRIIPTWGATEAFLPEDADLLIENTETGSTIARHNLKIIDTLFESTARLIGIKNGRFSETKQARMNHIVSLLKMAVNNPVRK